MKNPALLWNLKPIRTYCTLALLLLSANAYGQTVANPSFESNVLGSPFASSAPVPGWTHAGAQGDALQWRVGYTDSGGSVTTAGDGQQFVTMGGGFNQPVQTSSWSQTISGFTIGSTYLLSFQMASENTIASQSIMVSFLSGSLTSPQLFTAGVSSADYWRNWELKTMSFTASATSVALQFSATTTYDVGLDDVRISGVPEGGSSAVLLCGSLVALVFLRWKRGPFAFLHS
jgi:hypothetical protein